MNLDCLLETELSMLDFLTLEGEYKKELVRSLSAYIQLIEKWGRVSNLTAVRDPLKMVNRHIIDSLMLVPYLQDNSNRILDVGTGAGLPGIPLSLVLKDKQFTLLDSQLKKQIFLQHVVHSLKLHNVTLECTRSEAYNATVLFDSIVSRAFAPLGKMLSLTGHLLAPQGRFLAMKGKLDPQELENIGDQYKIQEVIDLNYKIKNNQTDYPVEARHLIIVIRNHQG